MNGGAIINPLQGLSEFTILFGDEKVRNKVYNYLVLEARVLADVVVGGLAVHVVPEVVPGPGEEGVVVLPHGEAVLVPVVVGLPLGPVKPVRSPVHVRPEPGAGVMLVMLALIRK